MTIGSDPTMLEMGTACEIDVLHLLLVQTTSTLLAFLTGGKALEAEHVLKSGVMASCHMHKKLHFLPNI